MNRIITGSIRKHEEVAQGRIKCANMDPTANHAEMSYKVSIKYE